MKIVLFGKNGQIGWELQRSLSVLGELIALERNSEDYCGDLNNLTGLEETIEKIMPDVIVNAAAYTAVDKAEFEIELAELINAQAPKVLANAAKKTGAWLVHYSSDYIFDGSGEHEWKEDDIPNPLNVYGQSKLQGELAIQASGCQYLIFRTSWVYAIHGNNFLKTILRMAKESNSLSIIEDQVGTPTNAELIADITAHAIAHAMKKKDVIGVYNLVAQGHTNWFEYAKIILKLSEVYAVDMRKRSCKVNPINSLDYFVSAKRPLNSRLSNEKIQSTFGIYLPDWRNGVERMIVELKERTE